MSVINRSILGKKSSPNRLIHEKSPYLVQHAWNPVNWYPWGDEAFKKARKEDKPIFLSIGYSTCHWCHVMAQESFEDEKVAEYLNKFYVAIKVDREERPDIDKIYMSVCQSLTGQGGWPLSIFMTPEGKPFFAGTYFPRLSRLGMQGFMDILKHISDLWQNNRLAVIKAGENITNTIQSSLDSLELDNSLGEETLKKCYLQLAAAFDPVYGGFGSAPKFPTPHNLTFLLRWHKRSGDVKALEIVEKTMDAMRNGGIFDHIGFGFHRYSVDEKWLVPHFEKMLYDQALLAIAYTEAYQLIHKSEFAQVASEIFTYVLRDMKSSKGGFYSAEDADSEGREGLFYLWTPIEVEKHLGKEAGDIFCRFYKITEAGNFEDGRSIIHAPESIQSFAEKEGIKQTTLEKILKKGKSKLFEVRRKREHPLKDDKILTSWNGLMIAALSKGYQVFGDQAYIVSAKDAARFILSKLKAPNGRLLRRYSQGEAAYAGYLDDYAFFVWGLIELYESTFDIFYLEEAIYLNQEMIDIFWDEVGKGLYFTGKGNESLIVRSKEIYDTALPSGNSIAALNLLRIGRMTGNIELEQKAQQLIQAFSKQVEDQPIAYPQLLNALDFIVGPSMEIVIAGDLALKKTQAMLNLIRKEFLPNKIVLLRQEGPEGKKLISLSNFVEPMKSKNQQPTAYLCKDFSCMEPINKISELKTAIN
jgi:uncharacterized protein YyaL (SSP411 family)